MFGFQAGRMGVVEQITADYFPFLKRKCLENAGRDIGIAFNCKLPYMQALICGID
jgi:hypothetical protein